MNRFRHAVSGRSELGVAALLGATALVLAIDTLGQRQTTRNIGVMGPQVVPYIVAAGLAVCAIALVIDVLRGGRGEPESSEDADVTTGTNWPTLLGLAGVIMVSALLIDPLGYVIASALLFYGAAIILGSRHFIRDLIIAAVLAVATFYAFSLGLGVHLPPGVLKGIL
jgi:putative tricarboxylic transport membrane protein